MGGLLLGLGLGGRPAAAATRTVAVSNVREAQAAFDRAQPGDRIALAPGRYGVITLRGQSFSAPVTVTSADPNNRAVLTDALILDGVGGLEVSELTLAAATLASDGHYPRIAVDGCRDLTLRALSVTGRVPTAAEGREPLTPGLKRGDRIARRGYDRGLRIRDSQNISLEDVAVDQVRTGLLVQRCTEMRLTGLDLSEMREGINILDSDLVEVSGSRFHHFLPWKAPDNRNQDHPDMIQYWGRNGTRGVSRVTIRDNVFYQPPDRHHTQTIYGSMNGAKPGISVSQFTVTGNTIVNGHLNAIALLDMQGALIADNLLLPHTQDTNDPKQVETPGIVLNRARDITVTRNRFLSLRRNPAFAVKAPKEALTGGAIRLEPDNVLLSRQPGSPLFWRRFLPDYYPG